MGLFFGEFIKQLIAAILAIFMPFSAATSAAAHAKSQTTITIPPPVVQRDETYSEEDEFVEGNFELPADETPADETPAE